MMLNYQRVWYFRDMLGKIYEHPVFVDDKLVKFMVFGHLIVSLC